MAICLFTTKIPDGSGDVVQTVKIADYIQKFITSSQLEELKNEVVIIVVMDDENKALASCFANELNPNIQVKKISELKEENHAINCRIEAGYNVYEWEEELTFQEEKPPLIVMPEYDNIVCHDSELTILGGFDEDRGDLGVIPSPLLLGATAGEVISEEVLQSAFERLDPRIKSYLGKDAQTYLAQRKQREFTYQYSHDGQKYLTFHTNGKPYQPYQPFQPGQHCATTEGGEYTPIDFFLQEHVMLIRNSGKSQDVLCIGENSKSKLQALKDLKDDLITNKYTRISFINIDTNEEEVIHLDEDHHGTDHKEYRVLYSKSMPFSSMQVLPLIANDIVGVTGDQSLVEAMSAKKLVTYECISHKLKFTKGYLKAVQREVSAMHLKKDLEEDVLLLARFLMKPFYRRYIVEYMPEEVARLLGNRNTVEVLKSINRQLVAKSNYFASLEKILMSAVVPYIKRRNPKEGSLVASDKEERSLVALLKALHSEVNKNKTISDQWESRNQAATQLLSVINEGTIIQDQAQVIVKQLTIINENQPSKYESTLIKKILDILSFGKTPMTGCLFFNHDETKESLGDDIEKPSTPSYCL